MMVYWPADKLLYSSDLFAPNDSTTWFTPEYLREAAGAVAREHLDVDRAYGMHYATTPWSKIIESVRTSLGGPT